MSTINIAGRSVTITETRNTYCMNLKTLHDIKEYLILLSTPYAKKTYLVFPKSDSRITPESIQVWCDKLIAKQSQPTPLEVKITEFFPNDKMIAYQALVLFPDNTKKAFYIDLRGKTVDAIQTLVKHMLTVIKEKVPNYKLIKLVGTGNFCDARASFMSH